VSEQGLIFSVGILVAVIAYFAKNFIFEPLLEFRKVKGKIQNRLKYHANIITNGEFPAEIIKPIREELRQLSCDLEEVYYSIALVKTLHFCLGIPNVDELNKIASNLIFLSNSTGSIRNIDKNCETIDSIKDKLRLN